MRSKLLKACRALLLAGTACGGASDELAPEPSPLGEQSQADSTLQLQPESLPAHLQALMDRASQAREGARTGRLRVYSFPWTFEGEPTPEMAARAVEATRAPGGYQPEPHFAPAYADLHPEVDATYWNGTEQVTVSFHDGQTSGSNHDRFVVLFPRSRKVVVYEEDSSG